MGMQGRRREQVEERKGTCDEFGGGEKKTG